MRFAGQLLARLVQMIEVQMRIAQRMDELARLTSEAGFTLRERLTIYPEYLNKPSWLDPSVKDHVAALADPATGLANEAAMPQGKPWHEHAAFSRLC